MRKNVAVSVVTVRRRLRDNGEYLILLKNFVECQKFSDVTAETLCRKQFVPKWWNYVPFTRQN